MIYSDWVNAIGGIFKIQVTSATGSAPFNDGFANLIVPRAIEYAELRISRDPEIDLLGLRTAEPGPTATCVSTQRYVTKPASVVVVEEINLISPAGQSPNSNTSTRTQLSRQTLSFINSQYPAGGSQSNGPPQYACQLSDTTFILGPTPDAAYQLEFTGTIRVTAMSSSSTSNYLTLNVPDLYLAASCVFFAGFQKNFGSQSDNPPQAMSWENTYQTLKKLVAAEEMRKKFRPTMLAQAGPALGTSAAN